MTQQLCDEFVFPKDKSVRQCSHPAKYCYQLLTRGRIDYLCGIHARRFKGSPNLTPLIQEKKP